MLNGLSTGLGVKIFYIIKFNKQEITQSGGKLKTVTFIIIRISTDENGLLHWELSYNAFIRIDQAIGT